MNPRAPQAPAGHLKQPRWVATGYQKRDGNCLAKSCAAVLIWL
jgi:hypothetical protein